MVAERGPIPARSEERRRRNKPEDGIEITISAAGSEVEVPEPDDDWHDIAYNWFLSLQDSGQHVFYEQSDWATAYLLAENLSRLLKPVFSGMSETWNREAQQMERKPIMLRAPIKGGELSAMLKGFTNLMVTEGDRRRMRLELAKPKPPEQSGSVTAIDAARRALGLAQ